MEPNPPFKLAIVGCGAITENGHALGAAVSRRAVLTTLIDLDLNRAKVLGKRFNITDCRNSLDRLEDTVDGVIVALPHHAHLSVGLELLGKGLHVLMEKPLGCTVAECKALADASSAADRVLATALVRRFASCNRLAKRIIDSRMLGEVVSFEIYDARLFSWPIKTPFLLEKDCPGRGVLIGNGSHFFDLVLWWFGEVAHVACIADSRNGGETDATVTLHMRSGASGVLHLSRIRAFDDVVTIQFERGILQLPAFGTNVRLYDREGGSLMNVEPRIDDPRGTNSTNLGELMALQIDDFVSAAQSGPGPEVGPHMATKAIELVEQCSAAIELAELPWRRRLAMPCNA